MAEVSTATANPPVQDRSKKKSVSAKNFHLFAYLSDDLKFKVLSFVADSPFESLPDNYPTSTLTHKLPLVSRKFRSLASSDLYWKDAVVRQTKKEPFLWQRALNQIRTNNFSAGNEEEEKDESLEEVVVDAYTKHHESTNYKNFYQNIVTKFLRYKGPVFAMEGQGMQMTQCSNAGKRPVYTSSNLNETHISHTQLLFLAFTL
jgi:hypothetical protein